MEPFLIACPKCQSRLKVSSPSLLGKRVACPKCKEVIVIEAPGTAAAPAQTGSADAPLARTAGRRPGTSGSVARSTPRRRASGGKGSGGFHWKLPAIIAGAAVVVCVAIVGVVFLSERYKESDDEITAADVLAAERRMARDLGIDGIESPPPGVAPSPAPKVDLRSAPTSDESWVRHEIEADGFALSVPPEWKVVDMDLRSRPGYERFKESNPELAAAQEAGEHMVKFRAAAPVAEDAFQTNVSVVRGQLPVRVPLSVVLAAAKQQIERVPNFSGPVSADEVVLPVGTAGRLAYTGFATLPTGRTELAAVQYLIVSGTTTYTLTCMSAASQIEKYRPLFDTMAHGFSVFEATPRGAPGGNVAAEVDFSNPEAVLIEFMVALAAKDKERTLVLIVPDPDAELLFTSGAPPMSQTRLDLMRTRLATDMRRLKPGDTFVLPNGRQVTIDETRVNETRLEIVPMGSPIPHVLIKHDGQWKVDVRPMIAGRKAAQEVRERRGQQ